MILNPDASFAESQFRQAEEEIRRLTEDARGAVSDALGSGGITAEIVNGQVQVTDSRNFGTLAFRNAAGHTANAPAPTGTNVPAQTIDAAYTQANLQATINTLIATINAQNTDIANLTTAHNGLLGVLQTAAIQS